MRDSVKVKRSASVITFNYDVSIDMAMFQAELGPSYGIFDAPRIAKGQQIPLLKLHGSLNWAISEPDRVIHPLHMIDLIPKISGLGLGPITFNIGSDIQAWAKVYGLKESLLKEPLIVPPSWNKADYHTALSGIWESAATHLSEAEYIFIAGYSLPETDSFFRHLFALGSTGKNPFRKIVVYDPNESINDRFRTMLGPGALATYEFKKLLFSEAISDVRQILNVPYPRS